MQYKTFFETPAVEDFLRLRKDSGLTPRTKEAAESGLPNTKIGVTVKYGDSVIGMGRIIGDGMCYQVVDIAVLPEHQGKGIGKKIMSALMTELKNQAGTEVYVSLIADGPAKILYEKFGFQDVAPKSIGMSLWINS